MQTQFSNLAALLALGILKKPCPDVDFSKADWDVLEPFLFSNQLEQIARHAFACLAKAKQPTPPAEVVSRFMFKGVQGLGERATRKRSTLQFSKKWVEEGKRPLAIGGIVFSRFYPSAILRGGETLVCIPLRRNAPDNVEVSTSEEQSLDYPYLHVEVPSTAVGPFSAQCGEEADAVLRSVFFSAPCELDPYVGLAYPNPEFLAVYHLYTAQQLLLHSRVPFIMLIDWIMLLHALVYLPEDKFDWAAFKEHITDLGLLRFTQRFTVLAQRLTSIKLSDNVAWVTEDVTDDDVNYLYECLITGVDADPAAEESKGRFSRFAEVLRNSKKYSRFSDVSPAKQAFRYLFS